MDFNLFPVVIRPWGKAEDCYRWPLYFSRSPSRRRASEELAAGYAAVADRLIARHDLSVALIADEQLDERIVQAVLNHMQRPERARMFSSRELNASQMTSLLRGLRLLLTSRYHACILSLAAAVPQVAVGHDLRLKTLYRELGLEAYFVEPGPGACTRAEERLEQLLTSPEPARAALRSGYAVHLARARQNRALLSSFVTAHGLPGPTVMANRSVVLLTGATGFVGTQVARRLLADTTCSLVALVRADDQAAAARRLERAWWDWPELVAAIGNRVEPLAGDVCRPGLGLADATLRALTARLTHVIHAAAELRLEAPLAELRRTNVAGTQHVLDVARAAQADHGVERFAYISTAYVCGSRPGQIEEAALTNQFGFSTAYEQSKFEAEALVRAAQAELCVSISDLA